MAGSSTAAWMLRLVLLPVLIYFHQMSAAPVSNTPACESGSCSGTWADSFQNNLEKLGELAKKCRENCQLTLPSSLPTAEKIFPGHFAKGLEILNEMQLNVYGIHKIHIHLDHLIERLAHADGCPTLVELYNKNVTRNSGPFNTAEDLHSRLDELMIMYKSTYFASC